LIGNFAPAPKAKKISLKIFELFETSRHAHTNPSQFSQASMLICQDLKIAGLIVERLDGPLGYE
jgi:hypothetical protein